MATRTLQNMEPTMKSMPSAPASRDRGRSSETGGPSTRGTTGGVVWPCLLACVLLLGSGCSVRKTAINMLGDALAGGGTTFASDNDPELVQAAIPFSLKLIESLLAETPEHEGLLLAAAGGFAQYSYAFVQLEADEVEGEDLAAATALRDRARRLYLRARAYGLRGLDARHKGFSTQLRAVPKEAVLAARPGDVPLLYWTAVAWGAAISISKDDPAFIAEIPILEALLDRALELDESWGAGAIHSLLISYEMSRDSIAGDPVDRARRHFDRALDLSGGRLAGPLLAFAESVCVQRQDLRQFDALLQQALAIDPDAAPEDRLVNLVMQRRARWLLSKRDELFLIPESQAQPAEP